MIRSNKNCYVRNAHISEKKFKEIVRCFALDLTAQATSLLVGVSRNSTQEPSQQYHLSLVVSKNKIPLHIRM